MSVATMLSSSDPRFQQRARLRERASIARLAEDRAESIQREIDTAEQRKEQAAAEHQRATGPVQNELQRIDARQAELSRNGEPIDAQLEGRRAELLVQVRAANEKLEAEVKAADAEIAVLTRERTQERLRSFGPQPAELIRTASPAARGRLEACRLAVEALQRLEIGLSERRQHPYHTATDVDAAIDAAMAEIISDARSRQSAAQQACIDE